MWLSLKEILLSSEFDDEKVPQRQNPYLFRTREIMPEQQPQPNSSAKRSARFTELMNSPTRRQTPLGTDTAWALKLKDAVDTAVRELHVQVLSAKPIRMYDADNPNDMLIELDTDKGRLQAIRNRAGVHSFQWVE